MFVGIYASAYVSVCLWFTGLNHRWTVR